MKTRVALNGVYLDSIIRLTGGSLYESANYRAYFILGEETKPDSENRNKRHESTIKVPKKLLDGIISDIGRYYPTIISRQNSDSVLITGEEVNYSSWLYVAPGIARTMVKFIPKYD